MRRLAFLLILAALAGPAAAGWLPEERLTERTDKADRTCLNNARAAAFDPAGNLHVAWYGESGGRMQTWYSRRDAATGLWSVDTVISDEASGGMYPCVAAGAGGVHVAWSTADSAALQYRRRSPAGQWDAVETVRTAFRIADPSIAIGRADSIHVAWSEETGVTTRDVFVAARGVAGWDDTVRLSARVSGHRCTRPAAAADESGVLGVAWQVYNSPEPLICFRARDSTGWSAVDTLQSTNNCNAPSLSASPGGVLHCLWQRSVGISRVLVYRQRRDGAWRDTVHLPWSGPGSVLADGAGSIHVVYAARAAEADTQLYHISADDSGRNWTVPVSLTAAQRQRGNPSLCVGPGDELAVAWTDQRFSQSYPDVFVRRTGTLRDLAVTALAVPDTVDSARVVRPTAEVSNQGEATESFAVWLTLPGGYAESLMVSALAPGGRDSLEFPEWLAQARGSRVAVCSIPSVADDTCPANNVRSGQFFVRVVDAAVESLSAPGFVPVRDSVRLRAFLHNPGNVAVEGVCRFEARDSLGGVVFRDSVGLLLAAGARAERRAGFVVGAAGNYEAAAVVTVAGDVRPQNDTGAGRFRAFVPDVGIESIIAPGPMADSGVVVRPAARVVNSSPGSVSLVARFRIGDGYAADARVDGLGPGEARPVEFADWRPGRRDSVALACSLFVLPDSTPGAAAAGRTFVRVRDFAAESLEVPGRPAPGETLAVRMSVGNRGNVTETGFLRFEVRTLVGALLHRDSLVLALAPGACSTLAFATVAVDTSGFVACSTACAGDMRVENNARRDTFVVLPSMDLAIIEVGPRGAVDSGSVARPQAVVHNFGTAAARFSAWMLIGDPPAYRDSSPDSVIHGGESRTVEFRDWTAERPGRLPVTCSLLIQPGNLPGPVASCSVFVRVRDAAAESIASPRGTLPARDTVRPVAVVRNRGNDTVSFAARFVIADSLDRVVFEDSTTVELDPGSGAELRFRGWRGPPGEYRAACRVRLDGDLRPGNDSTGALFALHPGDLWLTAIVAPEERVDSGRPVAPAIGVRNTGTGPAAFRAWFGITDGYAGSLYVAALPPGRDTVIEFAAWLPQTRGDHALACSLLALPESTVVGPVTGGTLVRVVDAAAESIVTPGGSLLPGPVVPAVRFGNRGNEEEFITCRLVIAGAGYADSAAVRLGPGRDSTVRFREWDARPGGFELVATVRVLDEMAPANDTCRLAVQVDSPPSWRWRRLADLPGEKPVRRGGRLVGASEGILGLRGTETNDWLCYRPGPDSWQALCSLPRPVAGSRARDGAAACRGDGDTVFLIKGRGQRALWRYRLTADAWDTLVALPEGLRPIRYGTGMAYLSGDTDRVFLATGSGRLGFLVYWVGPRQWHARRPVPEGPGGRRCRHGTDLVEHGGRLFLLKGSSDEFYEYFPGRDSWSARAGLPRTGAAGRSRRSGKGAALASDGGNGIYALKGRGNEFWRYDVAGDAWTQLEDVPPGDNRRKAGRGAALAGHEGRVYLLRGGGSRELWCYDPGARAGRAPERSGVASGPVLVAPRPAEVTVVRGVLRLAGEGTVDDRFPVTLLDAAGRRVMELRPGDNDVSCLAPGVYFVRAAADRRTVRVILTR
jgi:hypothetical protein